jgi:hypothetical protein
MADDIKVEFTPCNVFMIESDRQNGQGIAK